MATMNDMWKKLENEILKKNGSGVIRKLVCSDSSLYINFGIYRDTMTHFLSFEINQEYLCNYKALPAIKGVTVLKAVFGDEKDESVSLIISCASSAYNQSFDILCQDLVEYVKACSDAEIVAKLAERLGLWKKFFSEVPLEILTEEKQIGLAAELYLIVSMLENRINEYDVVNSWKGYDNLSKDFVFSGGISIEVKASKFPNSAKISSEQQLDEIGYDRCLMFFCHITSDDSGYSLNSLVDIIRNKLSDSINIIRMFNDGLMKYGYYDVHRDYYNRYFSFKKEAFYSIEADFPRIRQSDLREGVNSVRYSVDITNMDKYEMPFSAIMQIISSEVKNV